jgi:branched-subunit amino acid aminotransferase/4-amino-4-deoxychorismate lyase
MSLASVNGEIVPAGEATIPIADEGLVRGDGVFEVVRLYGGRPFAWNDHLARIVDSAQNLRLSLDIELVRREAEALLAQAPPETADGALRLMVTRGGRRIVILEPLPDHAKPIAVAPVTYAPPRILDGVKSLSYGGNMLATRLAKEQGADEALLVTPHGRVLEAPTSALFWVRGGALLTPPLSDHILDSITRRRLLEATDAREEVTTWDELVGADEAFLASTTREVQAIHTVGDTRLPAAPGDRTREAGKAFRRVVEDELAAAPAR